MVILLQGICLFELIGVSWFFEADKRVFVILDEKYTLRDVLIGKAYVSS